MRRIQILAFAFLLCCGAASALRAEPESCEKAIEFGGHSQYWNIWCIWDLIFGWD